MPQLPRSCAPCHRFQRSRRRLSWLSSPGSRRVLALEFVAVRPDGLTARCVGQLRPNPRLVAALREVASERIIGSQFLRYLFLARELLWRQVRGRDNSEQRECRQHRGNLARKARSQTVESGVAVGVGERQYCDDRRVVGQHRLARPEAPRAERQRWRRGERQARASARAGDIVADQSPASRGGRACPGGWI